MLKTKNIEKWLLTYWKWRHKTHRSWFSLWLFIPRRLYSMHVQSTCPLNELSCSTDFYSIRHLCLSRCTAFMLSTPEQTKGSVRQYSFQVQQAKIFSILCQTVQLTRSARQSRLNILGKPETLYIWASQCSLITVFSQRVWFLHVQTRLYVQPFCSATYTHSASQNNRRVQQATTAFLFSKKLQPRQRQPSCSARNCNLHVSKPGRHDVQPSVHSLDLQPAVLAFSFGKTDSNAIQKLYWCWNWRSCCGGTGGLDIVGYISGGGRVLNLKS